MQLKKIISFIGIVIFVLTLKSCVQDSRLPSASGKTGEIVVVIDKDKWETIPGELIKECFQAVYFGLPQPEPSFTLVNVAQSDFSDIFKVHRNIILVEIGKDKKNAVSKRYNQWSNEQLIVQITADSDSSFAGLFNKTKDELFNLFKVTDRGRVIKQAIEYKDKKISEKLSEDFNLSLAIPVGYTFDVDKKDENFAWISRETNKISQGIFIYCYKYTGRDTFDINSLKAERDSVLKKNVPGPRKGSYMCTVENFPLQLKVLNINNNDVFELRGLWETKGDFMGGPFLSHTVIDKKNNRVITVEGYVYAPDGDKRNYLQQLEAMIYTLNF